MTSPTGASVLARMLAGYGVSHVFFVDAILRRTLIELEGEGIRRVLAAAAEAKKKGLKTGVGLQRRHKPGYIEAVKRVQDGAIGRVMYGRTFWDMGAARAFECLRIHR